MTANFTRNAEINGACSHPDMAVKQNVKGNTFKRGDGMHGDPTYLEFCLQDEGMHG